MIYGSTLRGSDSPALVNRGYKKRQIALRDYSLVMWTTDRYKC